VPSLESASVKLGPKVQDSCRKGDFEECRGDDDQKGRCVLLGGLSSAVILKLTAHSGKVHILTSNFLMCSFVSLCQFPFLCTPSILIFLSLVSSKLS
jgi:hypothetical protein